MKWKFIGVLCFFCAFGCTAVPPDPKYLSKVDSFVASRTGSTFHVEDLLKNNPSISPTPPRGVLTLDDAIKRSLSRNLSLIASAENLAIAQAQLAQAGLLPNPAFNLSMRWPVPSGGIPDVDTSLSQTMNSLWTLPTQKKIAVVQRLQTGIDFAAQAFDVGEQVEFKYWMLVHLVRTQNISKRVAAYYDRALKAAEVRAKVGIVAIPEVNRARLQWEDSLRQIRKLESQYARSARELNWLLGVSTVPLWRLPHGFEEPPRELSSLPKIKVVETLALRSRLDLKHAYLDLEIAHAQVWLAQLGLIPFLQLGVDRERDESGNVKTGPIFGISIPVFDQGTVALALERARARQAEKNYTALEGQVRQDVRSAYATLALDLDDVRFFRERIIPQQEENVRLGQESFRLGNTDLDSLLNVLHDYASALQGYEDSLQSYYDDRVLLQRAVGMTWTRLLKKAR